MDARTGVRHIRHLERDGEIAAVAIVTTAETAAEATSITTPEAAAAVPAEAELVVKPSARHRGLGAQMLAALLRDSSGSLLIWAHGDHPDARALATRFSLTPERELFQLRLTPVRVHGAPAPVTAFRPGVDDTEWLALNALAFAGHPEQGQLTQTDLVSRLDEPWFNADDFLIARDDTGAMSGFCWLKVDGAVGEFYAVAVSPAAQGTGLGRALVNAGLARLVARNIAVSSLYVEGENTAALALYRSVGFIDFTVDVQYRGSAQPEIAGSF